MWNIHAQKTERQWTTGTVAISDVNEHSIDLYFLYIFAQCMNPLLIYIHIFSNVPLIHLDTLPSLMNYNFTIYFDFILNWIHSYIHVPNWSYFATELSIILLNFTNPAFIFYFAQLTDWLLMAIFKLLSLDNNSTPFNNWTRQMKESNQIQSNELTELKPQTTNCPIQWIVFIAKSEFRLRLILKSIENVNLNAMQSNARRVTLNTFSMPIGANFQFKSIFFSSK